jgi:hypothetical protein
MASTEQLNALMAEIGPMLEIQEVTGFESQNAWTLELDDQTLLFADHEPDQNRLVISGEVAKPHPDRKAALHELLLQYNYQWKTTGGVRMALDEPDGAVVQICDISTINLDASALAGTIQVFTDVLRTWRDMLVQEPRNTEHEVDFASQGFIRG